MGAKRSCKPGDGEDPIRKIELSSFAISACTVNNREFATFVEQTNYVTDAERHGWSFVFDPSDATLDRPGSWWRKVKGASWRRPTGPQSGIDEILNHPVVHVSWNDATEYAAWANGRLPTEAEWEFAGRGGLVQKRYPWGDASPTETFKCNIWRGAFPHENTAADGYASTCPVDTFKPNRFGMYNMVGNVWEWTADWFSRDFHAVSGIHKDPSGPPTGQGKVLKGGSHLCHKSYCARYRVSARSASAPDMSTGHIGVRIAFDAPEKA